jgi:predicted signal transduction protein with EAL and GGDEF domain
MVAQRLLDAAAAPHTIESQTVRVGVSIGVVVAKDGTTPEDILKKADIALYAAKSEARGSFRFFEMWMEVEITERQALRADLQVALERGEFGLVYQPLVDLRTHRVAAFEALLRWNHPVRGTVPPDVFIPIAEETGLIVDIGKWVLSHAALEATRWPAHISVAVNLSSRQFGEDDLVQFIGATLTRTGLAATRLELEITETVLMRESNPNLDMLRQLQSMGVRIALDDFGTGYSSLAYLQRFPFSKIKIDRTFVAGLPGSEESQAIVRAVIGLGRSLGLKVTAEGVETEAQLDWVAAGCDEAQGYLISRPIAAGDVARIVVQIEAAAVAKAGPPVRRAG